MGYLLRSVVLLVVCLAVSEAYIPKWSPMGGFLKPSNIDHLLSLEELRRVPRPQWFDQKLDHFNPAETRRWKQKYFTSRETAKGKALFVMIGGEGGSSPSWNVAGSMAVDAKKYDAVVLQLEHRFYGDSHPTPDMSVSNLRYLSSEQALADLAAFISAKKVEFAAEKVVVFGGSYPGCLAAWFRLKYPHLADGSVASSAPVLAKVDYAGYLEVLQTSMNYFNPSGECTKTVADATAEIVVLMKTAEGRKKLKTLFNLCEDIDINKKKDILNLYGYLPSPVAMTVQYNQAGGSGEGTISYMCNMMNDKSIGTPIQRYAQFVTPPECLDFSYDHRVQQFKKDSWAEGSNIRPYVYQTCAEFGLVQSTDSDKQPFGNTMPLDFYVEQCADIFGPNFNASEVNKAVNATNKEYGGKHYTENNIVFVNGNIDPWHKLSITKSLPNAPAVYINGSSHCGNMQPADACDPPALVNARLKVQQMIGQWLK